jgi:hypothetical protein
MQVELKQAMAPDEVGVDDPCGICGVPFTTGVVIAPVLQHDGPAVCPTCIAYLGRRNPQRFPSIEEYEEAHRRYTEPVYASVEEIMELEHADVPLVQEAYERS